MRSYAQTRRISLRRPTKGEPRGGATRNPRSDQRASGVPPLAVPRAEARRLCHFAFLGSADVGAASSACLGRTIASGDTSALRAAFADAALQTMPRSKRVEVDALHQEEKRSAHNSELQPELRPTWQRRPAAGGSQSRGETPLPLFSRRRRPALWRWSSSRPGGRRRCAGPSAPFPDSPAMDRRAARSESSSSPADSCCDS